LFETYPLSVSSAQKVKKNKTKEKKITIKGKNK
jgi:hypothetical protein